MSMPMHAEHDNVFTNSVCLTLCRLSVECQYCAKTNGHIVKRFNIQVGGSF